MNSCCCLPLPPSSHMHHSSHTHRYLPLLFGNYFRYNERKTMKKYANADSSSAVEWFSAATRRISYAHTQSHMHVCVRLCFDKKSKCNFTFLSHKVRIKIPLVWWLADSVLCCLLTSSVFRFCSLAYLLDLKAMHCCCCC